MQSPSNNGESKRIVFLDTYYPEVLKDASNNSDYSLRIKYLLNKKFGTSDFYSKAFDSYGWESYDLIANDRVSQQLYMKKRNYVYTDNVDTAIRQILDIQPQVLYCQDLNFFSRQKLEYLRNMGVKLIVSQHSCPWAGDEKIKSYDVVFTSFPHYLTKIEALGVKSVFLPIAFGGKTIQDALGFDSSHFRYIDISFVGGINSNGLNGNFGGSGHWENGTAIIKQVALNFEQFQWWGYIIGNELNSDLARAYRGHAWGLDMYKIYTRSKIVINRHGEVAEGYSNNMRMFEATGCGALLITENSKNIQNYFEPGKECIVYDNATDLIEKIRYYLQHDHERNGIAKAGYERTMKEHTYDNRLQVVRETLETML